MAFADRGEFSFTMRGPREGWTRDRRRYNFPDFEARGISVRATKNPDCSLALSITGLPGGRRAVRVPLPDGATEDLRVTIAWNEGAAMLYLEGAFVAEL